jgi:hypothetical protein
MARVDNLQKLKQINPHLQILAFTTLMRSPAVNTASEEPAYYGTYGAAIFRLTVLWDKQETGGLDPGETEELAALKESIPPPYLADWLERRAANLAVTARLLDLARQGVIDYLVLGRDDAAAYSQSHREYRYLLSCAAGMAADRFVSFPGADEIGLLLVTRLAALQAGEQPGVYVEYAAGPGAATVPSYEDSAIGSSMAARIAAVNGRPVADPDAADLVLMVNTPFDGVTREAAGPENFIAPGSSYLSSGHQSQASGQGSGAGMALDAVMAPNAAAAALGRRIKEHLAAGRPVAVADIAFANGSSNALMRVLQEGGMLPQLAAYAGMNTAGNAAGYALAQGLLAWRMDARARRAVLAVRLLDDWGYQANVRGAVDRELILPHGVTKNDLGAYAGPVFAAVRERLAQFARVNLADFGPFTVEVSFPWQRAFNIGVRVFFPAPAG